MLVNYVLDSVFVQRQSFEIWKTTKFVNFVPTFNTVFLQIDELKQLKMFLGQFVYSKNSTALILTQVKILDVAKNWR